MTIFQAFILGIIQGITEFLPISSSGHLVLAEKFFQWNIPKDQIFVFDVLVQMGTLVAVIVFFWRDLVKLFYAFIGLFSPNTDKNSIQSRKVILLIIATIPAGIIGLLLDDIVETVFSNAVITGVFLIFTAILMYVGEKVGKQMKTDEEMKFNDALVFGLFQAVAIFPGVSRSGATISGGLMRGFTREVAARFSFLMSVPIMIAAGIWALKDLLVLENLNNFIVPMIIGFVTAAIVGYVSIKWLLNYLTNNSLTRFSWYVMIVGIIAILIG